MHAMGDGGMLDIAIEAVGVDSDCELLGGSVRAGRYGRVTVEDTGCGMDLETLSRIFEPFFTTKEVGRGTGLGLALVHAIVSDLGGAIDVKSTPGDGSKFSIYLPLIDLPVSGA